MLLSFILLSFFVEWIIFLNFLHNKTRRNYKETVRKHKFFAHFLSLSLSLCDIWFLFVGCWAELIANTVREMKCFAGFLSLYLSLFFPNIHIIMKMRLRNITNSVIKKINHCKNRKRRENINISTVLEA